MATEEGREATLSDKSKHRRLTDILFSQKQSSLFCDVVLKVCSREIYAHSNLLAAASPYFEHFLSQDLPRLFSQRSPQIIEIQIEGNEPNVFYEEAVDKVIDFVYTGNLTVGERNVAQICEISKIMAMDNITSFCESFIQGQVQHDTIYRTHDGTEFRHVTSNTEITSLKYGSMLDSWSTVSKSSRSEKDAALLSKIKSRKLASIAVQTVPVLPLNPSECNSHIDPDNTDFVATEMKTYFPRKRGRPTKLKTTADQKEDEPSPKKTKSEEIDNNSDVLSNKENGTSIKLITHTRKSFTTRSGRKVFPKVFAGKVRVATNVSVIENSEPVPNNDLLHASEPVQVIKLERVEASEGSNGSENAETHMSELVVSDVIKTATYGPQLTVSTAQTETPEVVSSEKEFSGSHSSSIEVNKNDTRSGDSPPVVVSNLADTPGGSGTTAGNFQPLDRLDEVESVSPVRRKVGDTKRYVCPECFYETASVRDMTSHSMDHKMKRNQCFYCDRVIDNRDDLTDHLATHTGPTPFHCLDCGLNFKTRTIMNLHLPKHSDEKPFICEVCSMGFKWKHALTAHMTTHSNKKEHMCDICGYTTAWKAQLKSHKLIHEGKTFKCERFGCNFQTTKKQNLKFHEITHTGERTSMCEICGQSFSLKRNMRRHMLLHFNAKQHRCTDCEFASTRYDKLKEHLFKQHGKGTPPERRLKISDINQKHNLTIQPTGQFVRAPDQVEVWASEENQEINFKLTTVDVIESAGGGSANGSAGAALGTATQSGDVIAVIKDPESDTYSILNNILNASPGKNVILQNAGSERIPTIQEFTAQQVEGETESSIQQLVTEHQLAGGSSADHQTYQIVSQADSQMVSQADSQLADSGSLGDQTFQVFDGDNKMQVIKIQDFAARMNLSEGLTFSGQSIQIIHEAPQSVIKTAPDETQFESALPASVPYEQIVIEPYQSAPVPTPKENVLLGEGDGLVSQTDRVVIQGPDGTQVPIQVVKTVEKKHFLPP